MNELQAIAAVRACLAAVRPEKDIAMVADDAPLLEERVISSFDVVELLLHLEQATGRPIRRAQLVPGSFRDIATIARVFVRGGDGA